MSYIISDPHVQITQTALADVLRIGTRRIRTLSALGVLPKIKDNGYPLALTVSSYINYKDDLNKKVEVVAGSEEEKELILKNQERAERILYLRAKRLQFEKQLAPVEIILDVMLQLLVSMRTHVDSWLPKIKMAAPDLPIAAIEVLDREIAILMNELTEFEPVIPEYQDRDIEGIEKAIIDDS